MENFQEKPKQDENKFFDIRMMRPIAVKDTSSNLVYTLQQGESFEMDGRRVFFTKPNTISLFLSIAHRDRKVAKKIYDEFIKDKFKKKGSVEFSGDENAKLYDYFESIQTAIISIYTAVEALSNVAIPRDFIHEELNSRKVKELWDKGSIERWKATSEKIGDIIPDILKIESPKFLGFWSLFKQLEGIRNDIIHQKTTTEDPNKVDTLFLRKLLSESIFKVVESGFELIKYFCEKDKSHSFFPFGFGPIEVKPLEVDDINSFFEKVEDAPDSGVQD